MNFSIEEKHPGFVRHSEGRLSRRITTEVIKSLENLPESADAGAPVCVRHRVLTAAAPVGGRHVVRITVFHVEKTDISTENFNL